MAKYEEVFKDIIKRINDNEFIETNKIPTENELIKYYQVSRNTIRNAINVLKERGYIYPVQGSGYYIHLIEPDVSFLGGTKGVSFDHPGSKISTKVLHLELISCDKGLAQLMKCCVGTPIYYLERLRIIDDEPYSIEYTYYNKDIIPYIGREIAEGSIFRYIEDDLKLSFSFTDKYLSAEKLTLEESQLLNLNEGDPCFVIQDRVHLSNGQCFNVSRCVYHYQKGKFYTMVK